MNKFKKFISLFVCLLILSSIFQPVFAYNGTYIIANAEDFADFAKKCTLDSWSHGKTVELSADIDLSKQKNISVPVFCGTFNGNGYTISGFSITKSGSHLGLFRYISESGVVRDFNVKGTVTPQGTKNYIGGIAGENNGSIKNVSFDGKVSGNNYVGGIVGKNNGTVAGCSYSSKISGEQYTGGIAGENCGSILKCENSGEVNSAASNKSRSLDDLDTDIDSAIEAIKSKKEDGNEESIMPGKTDMGGIAGISSGVIQGCVNYGTVGYRHIGYNIGGIVGRQSGLVLGCENQGKITGRKDVGGIAGQAEPFVLLNSENSHSSLGTLRNELNKLSEMASDLIDDSDTVAANLSSHLAAVSGYADAATDNAHFLLNEGEDGLDENISAVNAKSAVISNAISDVIPSLDYLAEASDEISAFMKKIADSSYNYRAELTLVNDDLHTIRTACTDFSTASEELSNSIRLLSTAMDNLENAVTLDDKVAVSAAFSDILAQLEKISGCMDGQANAMETLSAALKESKSISDIVSKKDELVKELGELSKSFKNGAKAIDDIFGDIKTVTKNTDISYTSLVSCVSKIKEALTSLDTAMQYLSLGFDKVEYVLTDLNDYYNSDRMEDLRDLIKETAKDIKSVAYSFDDLSSAIITVKETLDELSSDEPLTIAPISEEARTASENIFEAIENISNELDAMRVYFDNERVKFSGNLHKLNNQFNLVMNLMLDTVEEVTSKFKTKNSLSDYMTDISDESLNSGIEGRIKLSDNYGLVEADRNAGGIVGSTGIEYAKNPENDLEVPKTLNFVYTARLVVDSCINNGRVTGKKYATGGIVGNAVIGTLYKCENYGNIESDAGDYVGGIAGRSDSSIRSCYSKGKMSGRSYVGGIAGRAEALTNCIAIAKVDGDEYLGAVAGEVSKLSYAKNNGFIDLGTGGIDGISRFASCKPYTYEEIKKMGGVPKRFISFTVTFTADGKPVKILEAEYGSETERIKLPEIPDKKGYFGRWQEFEDDTVVTDIECAAEYFPLITVLSSEEKDGQLPVALCEGEFTDKAALNVTTPQNVTAPKHSIGNGSVYKISVKNADIKDGDNLNVRLLNKDKKKAEAWQLTDGKWTEIKTSNRGKYTKMTVTGNDAVICVVYKPKPVWIFVLFAAIAGFVVCVAFVFVKLNSKKLIIK